MTAPSPPRRSLQDDSGAVLVLALVIVTTIALVIGGMLSFTDTNLRTTVQLRGQGNVAATADGAAQAAINDLRLHTFNNDTSSPSYPNCFGTSASPGTADSGQTLLLSNLVPGGTGAAPNSAAVRCNPDANTGAAGGLVPISNANKPGNAILTLSTNAAEDGLNVKANSTAIPFNVHGGIVSNSNITVTNGSLASNSTVFARTGCSGNISSTPGPSCTFAGALPGNPNYPAEISTVPAYQAAPTACSTSVVTFQPGYYNDAKALSDLMSSNTCKNKVWWFKPGNYYFDFQNTAKSSASANAHQWVVGVGQLIAGTPVDSAGNVLTQPSNPAVVPGACDNPIKSTTAVGVQFLFGGDSQLQVADQADAEICGSYHTDRPPVAIYGVQSGTATSTTAAGATATTVTSTKYAATPAPATDLTAALATTGGTAASWTSSTGNTTATVSLPAFAPAPAIPAGSTLTSAKLRFAYAASGKATRSLTVTPSSTAGVGTPFSDSSLGNTALAAGTQTVDLTAALSTTVASKGLTGLKVDYTADTGNGPGSIGVTDTVDAVYLDLTYTAPALRGQTTAAVPGNCLAIPYTQGSAGTGKCAMLYTATNYKGRFYVQGTTYTPLAPLDLALSNITSQVLRFGVVSRTLNLWETGAVSYQGPVIELPDNSPGYGVGDTVVYLSVTVCPGASTCAYDATKVALRVRVYVHDPTGAPVSGSRQMIVQTWAVQRK